MERIKMRREEPENVTASEIADYVFCGEAHRLRALGHESANQSGQRSGTTRHADLATTERVAGGSIAIGRVLIVAALLALLWTLL